MNDKPTKKWWVYHSFGVLTKVSAFSYTQKSGGKKMLREYKVNITETVMRHIWVVADDPQDAIDIAEQNYSQDETLDVSFDCDPTEWRK